MIANCEQRIILVDDMYEPRHFVEEMLFFTGYTNITSYENPIVALEEIRRNTRPAIVITDFNMPGLNGFELLTEIESHHPKIAAVIITADPLQLANQTRYHVIEKEPGFIIKLIAYIKKTLDK